jgi:DNA invertase Pin-like site-specific DNA recombinase
VKFHSLTEAIDTATPTGRAMWQMIGVLKAARSHGVKFGRKVRLTPERINHARKLIDKGGPRQYVADLLSVGRSTLYRPLMDSVN